MAGLQTTLQLRKMRRDWERRARENPRHYVLTGRSQWSDEEFFRSGEVTMQEDILNDLTNICRGRDPKEMTVLEIGCGAGRVTRAFANFFGSVWAVDISAEMVRQAQQAVAGFPNAHVLRNNGKDLSAIHPSWWGRRRGRETPQFDFAFSSMVFQHIPTREIIETYVRDVHGLLRPGGLFKFQVQGAGDVPKEQGDTWVGCSFTQRVAREMASRCGFDMRYESGARDQYYWLWFFKNSKP
jgi:cyclopropane fatty-acyl-phospholipid synthase-like methyltransferase